MFSAQSWIWVRWMVHCRQWTAIKPLFSGKNDVDVKVMLTRALRDVDILTVLDLWSPRSKRVVPVPKIDADVLVYPWPSWQNHCVGDFFNVTNRLPTSQNCHQHTPSPTSVTNIDGNVHFTTGRCTRFCLHFTRKISIIELFLVSKTVPKIASSYF